MHLNSVSFAAIAVSMSQMLPMADAFWRLPCQGRLGVGRLDPLVDPGKISSHAHAIHGGSNFNLAVTSDLLQLSECTSCAVKQDKSIYWTPALYFENADGSTELVDEVGGMLVYYLLYGDDPKPFPKGFRMLAGDAFQRNFTLPVPDPPKSSWSGEQSTQFHLGQKAIGFNCLNYAKDPEPSMYRHTLPDKEYLDAHCTDGIRMELMFPSCWNGKDLDSKDHKSHVQYPSLVNDGVCPEGFETRIVSLFYETIWNTYAYKGKEGRFLIANGDPTGCGYHGDFIEGWDENVLEQAVSQCKNPSGQVQDCPIFELQDYNKQNDCKFNIAADIYNEDCLKVASGLPGNVAVHAGPGYVKGASSSSSSTSSSATPSLPSVGYTPATPTTPSATPSASASASAPPSPPSPSSSSVDLTPTVTPGKFYAAEPSNTSTPTPVAPTPAVDAKGVETRYSTEGNTVYELIIVQEEVTTTLDVPCDATPAPEVTEGKTAYKRVAKRHPHAHAHGHAHGHRF